MRKLRFVAPLVGIVIAVTACIPTQAVRAVDGDTIETSHGTVRVLGIDTPERGEPCYDEAKARVAQLTVGGEREIIYNSASEDRDKYDRLLRHVSIKDVGDLGAVLIREGLANARYDSLDGYQRHRNQDAYRSLDAATPHRCGPAMDAVGDSGGAAPAPAPAPTPGETYFANCDAVRAAGKAPLHVGEPGYRLALDRDGDGVACE